VEQHPTSFYPTIDWFMRRRCEAVIARGFTNVASDTILIFLKEINLYAKIYTSQQQKRYRGLMLNMFYREKKIVKNRII
jgi:hypothetical protein